ncbi:hypothetical protein V8F63_15905 [Brevundimonas sp. LF-1]
MQTTIRPRPNASSPSCSMVSPPMDRLTKASPTTPINPTSSAALRSFCTR